MLEQMTESSSADFGAQGKRLPDPAPSPIQLPDLLLVERARCKDRRAHESLMRRYNQRLFRIARSIVCDPEAAENVVQEAYLLAFADLERYEPTGATGKFGAWLARLAFNQALALRRSFRPGARALSASAAAISWQQGISEPGADEHADAGQTVPAVSDSEEDPQERRTRQMLESAIDLLPEVFRTVFVLRAVEKISGMETAACLGINETTVRTRLHRAQRRLQAMLEGQIPQERANIFALQPERGEHIVSQVFARLTHASLLPKG
jgi:RNA polymerase sigma-70 factor (ECF subfamily)